MNFQDMNLLDGLQFIPVNKSKQPLAKNWQTLTTKHDLTNCANVGLVCGSPSGGIEVIDIDEKYCLSGSIFETYKRLIHSLDEKLLAKLVVQKTKNNGFHLIYRCKKIAGNTKLANRETTEAEKNATYETEYHRLIKEGKDDDEAKKTALKISKNDKVRVLIETRGIGGQVVCFPSEGYQFIHGDFYSITELTETERDLLIGVARQFNQYHEEVQAPRVKHPTGLKGISPFEDYNERGDVVGLLESHGWKIVGTKGNKTIFLRPGQTSSQSSGNFDHDKNWFSVFTTSTEFEPQKAYLPYAVFAYLECNRDFSLASQRLFDLGFGEKPQLKADAAQPSPRTTKSRIVVENDDLSFLATPDDYDSYLQMVRDGTLPQGLTTGSPALDQHFLFKEGNLVMTNGIDNTGKSVFTWWLLLLAAMYHGWKGIIFSSENTLGSFMRKMIQFYWGKPLHGQYAMSDQQFQIAKKFVEEHFSLIRAQEDLFNYKDIINAVKKINYTKGQHNYAMIDPYNSLKIDISSFSKLNTHEYHYEALSEIKSYGQINNFGWFINHHAVTAAARTKDGEKKYPAAPNKADTEGGQKVANKADDFLTIHRITQHPTDWMVTEVHVRKIKDTETGGRPTSLDMPVKFEMYKNGCAFLERLEMGGTPIDPIHQWHQKRQPQQQPIQMPDLYWTPYKDDDGNSISF